MVWFMRAWGLRESCCNGLGKKRLEGPWVGLGEKAAGLDKTRTTVEDKWIFHPMDEKHTPHGEQKQ
jgi:hypothetical protein